MKTAQKPNHKIVPYEDLLSVTRTGNAPELATWLEENNVPFFRGRDRAKRPFTTRAELNSALGLLPSTIASSDIIEVI